MPTCPQPTDSSRGFTLIEMLVVLTILSLLAAVMAGRLGGAPGGLSRQKAAQALRIAFAEARLDARRTGRPVLLDPAAVAAGTTLAPGPLAVRPDRIAYFPDGSASGGRVLLGGAPLLEIDWLTGDARNVR